MRKLIIMNGRFKNRQHIYIAAYSKADAGRILAHAYNSQRGIMNEINEYFSIGCWGKLMDGIEPERGAWVIKDCGNDKPERII